MTSGSRALAISLVRTVAVAAAMLMVTVLTVSRSQAVFTATTANSANSFTAGTVVLTDDDSDSAMFSAGSGMVPGTPLVACIEVTYAGDLMPAPIRLHATTTGDLDTYLDTTIEVGTGGSFGDCTGFSLSSTPYTGTLANLSTTYTDYASGLALYTISGPPAARTIRFTIEVQSDDAAQGRSSTAVFTFETQV